MDKAAQVPAQPAFLQVCLNVSNEPGNLNVELHSVKNYVRYVSLEDIQLGLLTLAENIKSSLQTQA